LLVFIFAAVFGLYAMVALSPHGHEAGCASLSPLSGVCAEVLAHVGHWQSALLAIGVEILVVVALALFLVIRPAVLAGEREQYAYYRLVQHIPVRPTLFQKLFSQGILNRKEPLLIP
jgi:hypothetical protein